MPIGYLPPAYLFFQLSGQRLVVVVDEWEVGSVFPFGHYVQTLGPVGEVYEVLVMLYFLVV